MFSEEVRDIFSACAEFAKKEGDKDPLKVWKKGFELGYFNLSELSAVEVSAVFEGVFSANPNLGVPLLYFTLSKHIFDDFASLAYPQERIITDFSYERYFKMDNSEISFFLAEERYYTPELKELKVVEVVDIIKSNYSVINLLNLLLSARCVGTARYALKAAINYLMERERAGYESFNYCHTFEKIGEISAEIEASRLMLYHTASLLDSASNFISVDKSHSSAHERLLAMTLWKAACTAVVAADESAILQEGFLLL